MFRNTCGYADCAFVQRQTGPFAVESVRNTDKGLTIRFPARATDVGLADNPAPVPGGEASVRFADLRRATGRPSRFRPHRLLQAAGDAGPVKLTLSPVGGEPTLLADNAHYGLVTGYAPLSAGQYDATVTANGRDWHQGVEVSDGGPTTFVLTDGPDGPLLQQMRDGPAGAVALDPSGLTMPGAAAAADKDPAKHVIAAGPRQKLYPVALSAIAIAAGAVLIVKAHGRQRQ